MTAHPGQARQVCDALALEADAAAFGIHGLHVRVGDDVAEHRWAPDVREEIHSVAKGVSVLAAGIAVAEGLIDLETPLGELVDDMPLGAGVAELTVRRLLTMTSGIDLPWSPTMMTDWPDLAAEFLSRDSRGPVFQYSNASTYTAMAVLARRTGDVVDYLRPRLFGPLGLDDVHWRRSPNGRVLAGEGIALRTEEMARLGTLIRDRGVWRGERLVPADVVDAMHTDWVQAGSGEGYRRYALAGWDGPGDVWRLHGAYGQLVILHGDAVVTVSADDHAGADAFARTVATLLARR